jgi:hypothetical protein
MSQISSGLMAVGAHAIVFAVNNETGRTS